MRTTSRGSCHYGAVHFEAKLDLAAGTSRCNCSICSKQRYWMGFVPHDAFRLLQGAEALADYQIDEGKVHHRFCRHCGIKPFGNGIAEELDAEVEGDFYAINVACLDTVPPDVLADVPITYMDGANDNWNTEPVETRHL